MRLTSTTKANLLGQRQVAIYIEEIKNEKKPPLSTNTIRYIFELESTFRKM